MTEVTRHVLASANRAALFDALVAAGRPLSVADGARLLGIAESTARFHLDHLVHAGLVKRTARRQSRGRPENLYEAIEPEAAGLRGEDYRQLAGLLAGEVERGADPAEAARAAGRRWSQEAEAPGKADVDPAEQIVALMTRLGFEPRLAGADAVLLHRCPFEAVARHHRDVVCGIHLGLIEETLRRRGDAARVAEFRPFVWDDPLLCLVRIAPSPATATPQPAAPSHSTV